MRLSAWLLALLALASYSSASKILALFVWPARSHYILAHRLMVELATKGHEVTMVTPYKDSKPRPNYTEIYIPEISSGTEQKKEIYFDLGSLTRVNMLIALFKVARRVMDLAMPNQQIIDLANSNQTFDVIVLDLCFMDPLLVFSHIFNAPIVYISTMGNAAWNHLYHRNPTPLAYLPNVLMHSNGQMSFSERLHNLYIFTVENVYRNYVLQPHYDNLVQRLYPGAPSIWDMSFDINSITLVNSHISTNDPAPRNPNVIEVGGFHPKTDTLPNDLQQFMDEHPEGVVYFALGTNVKSTGMPLKKREAILKALGKIKHKVLWKWEEEMLPGQPENVRLGKWFPQQALLAHPNMKLFISHGGLLSTAEAVEFGVPILGIPLVADQKMNIMFGFNKGFALSVPFFDLTEEKFTTALTEMLNNKTYGENAKKHTALIKDRLVHPLEEAVYWVEYTIRHKGAPHMRNGAVNLALYEYEMLDVAVFLVAVCLILPALLIHFFLKDYKDFIRGKKHES